MKAMRLLFCLMVVLFMGTSISSAAAKLPPGVKLSAAGDTMYITGGTLANLEHAGALETAINGDTAANGTRNNPNRIYAL
ncbi:MAG TPA: hypothetical protein VMM58_07380, partial [Bacteroidota bacterium]|nr:hypothetical protein [Bacteroidota bacterium]